MVRKLCRQRKHESVKIVELLMKSTPQLDPRRLPIEKSKAPVRILVWRVVLRNKFLWP